MKIVVCILITTSILCGDFGCIYASETKIITQSNTEIDKNKKTLFFWLTKSGKVRKYSLRRMGS